MQKKDDDDDDDDDNTCNNYNNNNNNNNTCTTNKMMMITIIMIIIIIIIIIIKRCCIQIRRIYDTRIKGLVIVSAFFCYFWNFLTVFFDTNLQALRGTSNSEIGLEAKIG